MAMLDPTLQSTAREAIMQPWADELAGGDHEVLHRTAFLIAALMRTTPLADAWRKTGWVGNPYFGLAAPALHWDADLLHLLRGRFDGITPGGYTILSGTGSVMRVKGNLLGMDGVDRPVAVLDAVAATWRRLTAFGVTLGQFVTATREMDDFADELMLTTALADQMVRGIRPPDGLARVVCLPLGSSEKRSFDLPDEPPF